MGDSERAVVAEAPSNEDIILQDNRPVAPASPEPSPSPKQEAPVHTISLKTGIVLIAAFWAVFITVMVLRGR